MNQFCGSHKPSNRGERMQNILLTPKSFDNSIRFQLKFREYLGTPYSPVPNNGGVLIKGGREEGGGEGSGR